MNNARERRSILNKILRKYIVKSQISSDVTSQFVVSNKLLVKDIEVIEVIKLKNH